MAENITTQHTSAGDGGMFCRYTNENTGQTSSFYWDSTPCPSTDDIEFGNVSGGNVGGKFGGGKFSGGSQCQISRGFGSSRRNALVMGLGGSQIARARAGRSVSYNPIYNKPRYVVSANMRELRRRK